MTRYLLTGMIFALGCTTASAQSPTDPQADTQRLGGAPTLAAGPPPPDDAAGEVTVWTDGSAQTGYSAFTCDGSGNVATNTLTATQSTWTVNATPAGVYSASTIGIGVTDPGAYFDLRYAWGGGKDAIDVAMAGPNTSNGIEIDFARGYGSDFTHPTSTDWTTVLYDLDAWGYTTGDTPALASHVRSTVDEHNTATTIPGDVEDLEHDRDRRERRELPRGLGTARLVDRVECTDAHLVRHGCGVRGRRGDRRRWDDRRRRGGARVHVDVRDPVDTSLQRAVAALHDHLAERCLVLLRRLRLRDHAGELARRARWGERRLHVHRRPAVLAA